MSDNQEYKFCTKCGNKVFAEAIMCPKCGTQFTENQSSIIRENTIPNNPDYRLMCFKGNLPDSITDTSVLNPLYPVDVFLQNKSILLNIFDDNKVRVASFDIPYSDISVSNKNLNILMCTNIKSFALQFEGTVISFISFVQASKKEGLNKFAYFRFLNNKAQNSINTPPGYSVSTDILEQLENELRKRL